MSEQNQSVRHADRTGSAAEAGVGGNPLRSNRGRTIIEDDVVEKIAGFAAREVDVIGAGGSTSQSVGGLLSSLPGVSGDSKSRGVSVVEVGEVEATLTVAYGLSIPQTSDAVRRNVVNRVESLTSSPRRTVNGPVFDGPMMVSAPSGWLVVRGTGTRSILAVLSPSKTVPTVRAYLPRSVLRRRGVSDEC